MDLDQALIRIKQLQRELNSLEDDINYAEQDVQYGLLTFQNKLWSKLKYSFADVPNFVDPNLQPHQKQYVIKMMEIRDAFKSLGIPSHDMPD